jgi:hypothetical protein
VEKARPGAMRLTQHPFYPGGGGQLAGSRRVALPERQDVAIAGFAQEGDGLWVALSTVPAEGSSTSRYPRLDLRAMVPEGRYH